jgi:hypothetical protein
VALSPAERGFGVFGGGGAWRNLERVSLSLFGWSGMEGAASGGGGSRVLLQRADVTSRWLFHGTEA